MVSVTPGTVQRRAAGCRADAGPRWQGDGVPASSLICRRGTALLRTVPPGEGVVRLRGRLHQVCAVLSVPAAVVVARAAEAPVSRRAGCSYGAGLVTLFSVSAAYHRGSWTPETRRALERLDHAAIFGFAAASYGPLALALPSAERRLLLTSVWSGAVAGSVLKCLRLEAAGGAADVVYLLVGWAGLLVLPSLVSALSAAQLALLLGGGLLYTSGALVLVGRWPDPAPAVFGYHEVGHLVMLLGTALHYALDLSILSAT